MSPAPPERSPARAPGEEFGLTPAQLAESDRGAAPAKVLNRIEARVVSVEHTGSGYTVLKLDNGQQWTEVSPSQRPFASPGDVITIRKAALGSYFARGPNSAGVVRVRRIN